MPEWLWLTLAVERIGMPDAEQRLQRAWFEGTLHLRGTPSTIPETKEFVEIPWSEAGHLRLDCRHLRLVRGSRRLWFIAYRSVQAWTADVERLAQADVENMEPKAASAGPPPMKALPSPALPANALEGDAEREKSGTLAEALASELRRLHPTGRPAMRRAELRGRVLDVAGDKLGVFELTTLDRAMRLLGWTTRRPKPAKRRRQPSR
jgi:hypothetical protein